MYTITNHVFLVLAFFFWTTLALIPGTIYLTDGKSLQSGVLSLGLKYQSSGILKEGGCSDEVKIQNCYAMVLTAAGELAPLKRDREAITEHSQNAHRGLSHSHSSTQDLVKRVVPRQRIEILSWAPSVDGDKNLYKWKYFLTENIHSSSHFFHIVQLFSRNLGGFVISLGLRNGRLVISDNVRPKCGGICPSLPLEDVWGKTLYHRMMVTWGPEGSIQYTIQEEGSKTILLEYSIQGNVPSGGSLKTGLYRASLKENSDAIAYVGDFDFTTRV